MKTQNPSIIKINHINKSENFALVPGYSNKKKKIKLKEFSRSKGNCYFTKGISAGLIDFVYRAVIKLKIKEKKIIFSRGAVKINGKQSFNSAAIKELDWDTGISVRIPHRLNYNNKVRIIIDKKERYFRMMEIIALSSLLRIANPGKNAKWCTDNTIIILNEGWESFLANHKPSSNSNS